MKQAISTFELNQTWETHGYYYRAIWEEKQPNGSQIVIAEQRIYKDGEIIAYEVFKTILRKERLMFGSMIPSHYAIPGTELWGKNAFTVWRLLW